MEKGSLVICQASDWVAKHKTKNVRIKGRQVPSKGTIYTVRDKFTANGLTGLYLEEIINKKVRSAEGLLEPCWDARQFKVVKTPNIDSIRQILTDIDNGKILNYDDPKKCTG